MFLCVFRSSPCPLSFLRFFFLLFFFSRRGLVICAKMRRGGGVAQTTALWSLWASCRRIHRHHSPDRTFSQEIQDRQNAFQWSARHVFRPHQHFSYDPSSWSRSLEEKTKQQHKLSLVERVQLAQEHEAERTANVAAIERVSSDGSQPRQPVEDAQTAAGGGEDDDLPSYFFALGDATAAAVDGTAATSARAPPEKKHVLPSSWDTVSLQELVEEVQRLQRLLYSRRYAGNASLARRARQEGELRVLLLHLFERLDAAVLEETLTVDACTFGWFTLLQHVEPLVEAVARATQPPLETQEAVQRVFVALQRGLLRPMEKSASHAVYRTAAAGELSLEALVELLSVAASPFVRNCGHVFQTPTVSTGALEEYAAWVAAAAHQRACATSSSSSSSAAPESSEVVPTEAEGDSALCEWVDPTHLNAWAAAVKHLRSRGCAVAQWVPGLVLQVSHAALYVTRTLESVTGVSLCGRVKTSLVQRRARFAARSAQPGGSADASEQEDANGDGEGATRKNMRPKAVVLDATAAPRGVQAAPTECDDVSHVLSATTQLLQLSAQLDREALVDVAAAAEEHVRRLVTECLQMTSQAPNYDVEGDVVVPWACALLQSGALLIGDAVDVAAAAGGRSGRPSATQQQLRHGTEDVVHTSLRFLLLLSRLSFMDVVDRPALGRLVLLLAQWPEPACMSPQERAEWRRLRGLVMRAALDRLTVDDLAAAAAEVGGVSTWVETLAYGEYDGTVPLPLWRAACDAYLPPSPSAAASACSAEVAMALLLLGARYAARESAGRAPAPANFYSQYTAQRVAVCVGVLRGSSTLAEALVRAADAWDAVSAEVPATLHPLLSAMQAVVRRETTQTRVLNF